MALVRPGGMAGGPARAEAAVGRRVAVGAEMAKNLLQHARSSMTALTRIGLRSHDQRPGVDAGFAVLFAFGRAWPDITHLGC